jgi:outer membrane protein assembly factor BamB
MSKRWINILLSLLIVPVLFTACKKQYSSDKPLPTSYYPSIIISSDNQVVYGIDPGTGKKNWEFSMPHLIGVPTTTFTPSPLLYNEMVYLTAINSDTIYKINSKTGALVAKMTLTPYTNFLGVIATPIADGSYIYLAAMDGTLYVIDTGAGKIQWKYSSPDGTRLSSSPTIYNGNVYFASTGGHVYCLNKANGPDASGNPVWDYPGIDSVVYPLMPSFISSPSICPPYLYIGSVSDSNMYCIYLTPPTTSPPTPLVGKLRWTFKTGGAINSSPTTFAGKCIFGSNDFYVYCVDTQTHSAIWHFRTSSRVNSSPIIDNQTVYIGSDDYNLYSLNIINGTLKWGAPFKANGLIKSSPLPYKGTIYIGSYDGNLYAVDSAQGTLKWSFFINGNIEGSPVIDDLTGNNTNVSQISGYIN